MMELIREIEQTDIPRIKELINKAGRESEYESVERLGGMTNRSYKVILRNKEELLVRIPGEGTEGMINRSDERKSTELACRLNIDSSLLFFGDDGTKVMEFIHNPRAMSEAVLREDKTLLQVAEIFYRLHHCGENTGVRFEVFEMATLYEKIIADSGVRNYEDYLGIKDRVVSIKKEMEINGIAPRVPCHNDPLIGNWVMDENEKLYLIDWEYSGMNEAMWDLSCLSIEADYTSENDETLLTAYYSHGDRMVGAEIKRRFLAAKVYVDYLWTLWGLTRVPFDGDYMQVYADGRYSRLKKNIEAYYKM